MVNLLRCFYEQTILELARSFPSYFKIPSNTRPCFHLKSYAKIGAICGLFSPPEVLYAPGGCGGMAGKPEFFFAGGTLPS
jgi:hypothetical protein